MARKARLLLSTAAALTLLANAAAAGTSPFVMVSGANDPGIDVSLTVQASSVAGYDYDFVVSNNSSLGSVTGVYFEMDWNSLLWSGALSSGPASLNAGTLSPQIDGWSGSMESHTVATQRIRYWEGRRYYDVYEDVLAHGLQPSQSQVFSFAAGDLITLADLEAVLGDAGFGVGIRIQDLLPDDPQATGFGEVQDETASVFAFVLPSLVVIPPTAPPPPSSVPTPTASLAGLTLLGLSVMRRRRA